MGLYTNQVECWTERVTEEGVEGLNEEQLRKQRERRKANGNAATHKYERTVNGKLMRIYRNMQSRIEGVQWQKAHLYSGKYLLPREEFYSWAKSCPEFYSLYEAWVDSGFERRLAPSVDRVDSSLGYEISNMEWVTHSENSRRGSVDRDKLNDNPP